MNEGNEAFMNLLWFMSGAYCTEPEDYNKKVLSFQRYNRERLTDDQHAIIDQMIEANSKEVTK